MFKMRFFTFLLIILLISQLLSSASGEEAPSNSEEKIGINSEDSIIQCRCLPLFTQLPISCSFPFGGWIFQRKTIPQITTPTPAIVTSLKMSFMDDIDLLNVNPEETVTVNIKGFPKDMVAVFESTETGQSFYKGIQIDLDLPILIYWGQLKDDGTMQFDCELSSIPLMPGEDSTIYLQAISGQEDFQKNLQTSNLITIKIIW
ncbi:MAG: hypothetical protein NTX88_05765 [Candidatus Atribacteria bacterium]|nr:hypothetical protein [Candidatus Atribacteria bacterium]